MRIIINNYDDLVLSIRLNDIKRVEELLSYSDCRSEIICKYVEFYGVVRITKLIPKIKAKALKDFIINICEDY